MDAYFEVEVRAEDDDFIIGILKIMRKCDSIWVIVHRLNKSDYFILVRVDYNVAKLENIYVKKIMEVHGKLVSNVSNKGT